jgi:RNA polymerase sigma factor (sigma-70 family)
MKQIEAELVSRVLMGDKAAFDPLIERYGHDAFKTARRILRDPIDAEDVTQDAILQAFLGLSSLQKPDRFGPWLIGIVINLCKMRLRARRDWHPADEMHGGRVPKDFTLADLQPSPESIYEATELHRKVLEAVQLLPADQQQAIRMHYLDGLSVGKIATLVGVSVGAVKVRMHRARSRLRLDLMEAFGRLDEPISSEAREVPMIEVTVHDVMVRAPKHDPDTEWLPGPGKKYKLGFTRVLLLKEIIGNRVLPIWVGPTEGDWIGMLLAGVSTPRPTTFELIAKMLDFGEMKIEKIAVTALRKDTFYATIWMKVHGGIREVDARPSDALTLALRTNVPILVAPELLEANHGFVNTNAAIQMLDEQYQKFVATEETEMEWRSFRSIPQGDMFR